MSQRASSFAILCLLVFVAAVTGRAQCPRVAVTSPDEVDAGASITYTVAVSGGDQNVTPTFNWTVSAGTISAGQGTSTIQVDTAGAAGTSATATVDVGGYPRQCSTASSSTTSVRAPRPSARKMDEYGAIKQPDRNARLDNFAIELQNDPMTQGYLIAYGARRSARGAAAATLKSARNYLVMTRGIDPARLVNVDGGYREESTTELWVVPMDSAPQATPTVDPSEVKAPVKKKPATRKRTR